MPPIVPRCLPSGDIAAILLGGSFMRLYSRRNQYQKRNPLSIALFWGEAVIVLRRALESMASSGTYLDLAAPASESRAQHLSAFARFMLERRGSSLVTP